MCLNSFTNILLKSLIANMFNYHRITLFEPIFLLYLDFRDHTYGHV